MGGCGIVVDGRHLPGTRGGVLGAKVVIPTTMDNYRREVVGFGGWVDT
jgi:hypothetical protein